MAEPFFFSLSLSVTQLSLVCSLLSYIILTRHHRTAVAVADYYYHYYILFSRSSWRAAKKKRRKKGKSCVSRVHNNGAPLPGGLHASVNIWHHYIVLYVTCIRCLCGSSPEKKVFHEPTNGKDGFVYDRVTIILQARSAERDVYICNETSCCRNNMYACTIMFDKRMKTGCILCNNTMMI